MKEFDPYGTPLESVEGGLAFDPGVWQEIGFDDVVPGDLVVPAQEDDEQVEMIRGIDDDTIYTFGSTPQANETGERQNEIGSNSYEHTPTSNNVFLRYVGPYQRS